MRGRLLVKETVVRVEVDFMRTVEEPQGLELTPIFKQQRKTPRRTLSLSRAKNPGVERGHDERRGVTFGASHGVK